MDLYATYDRLKVVYAGASRALPGGYALPMINLVIELTYRCNLRCSMCYQRRQERELNRSAIRPQEELTLAQIQNLVDQTPPTCILIFSGGEPFCRPDLMDILVYATARRKCHLVTNGALATPAQARKLVEMGLLSVGVSVDGRADTHDVIRGIPGTFERMARTFREIRAQRSALGRRRPVLNMKTVISAGNVDQVGELLYLGNELGADYCTFQLENTSLEISALHLNQDLGAYAVAPAPVQGIDRQRLEAALEGLSRKNGPSARFLPHLSTGDILAHYENRLALADFQCHAPWTGMNVSPYGDVFPCVNYAIGNVKQQSLASLWNNERFRQMRQKLRQDGLFAACAGCCDLERKLTPSMAFP